MKRESKQSVFIFSGMSVSPTGRSFSGDYKVLYRSPGRLAVIQI